MAGFVSFFPRIDSSKLVALTTITGGILTIISAFWFNDMVSVQICYAVSWGFLIGKCCKSLGNLLVSVNQIAFNPPLRTIIFVKYLGLDRLTNAFGLSMLVMGFGALAGSPIAGFLIECDGTYTYAFVLSGGCQVLSGLVFLCLGCVHKGEMKRNKISRKS